MSLCIGACAHREIPEIPPPPSSESDPEIPGAEDEIALPKPMPDEAQTLPDAMKESAEAKASRDSTLSNARAPSEESKPEDPSGVHAPEISEANKSTEAQKTAAEDAKLSTTEDKLPNEPHKKKLDNVDDYSVSVDPPGNKPLSKPSEDATESLSDSAESKPPASGDESEGTQATSKAEQSAKAASHQKAATKTGQTGHPEADAKQVSANASSLPPEQEKPEESLDNPDSEIPIGQQEITNLKKTDEPGGQTKVITEQAQAADESDRLSGIPGPKMKLQETGQVTRDEKGDGVGSGPGAYGAGSGNGIILQGQGRSVQWNLQRPPLKD